MCHLCRKAQALRSSDTKAFKKVGLALARLHRNIEPNLGDLWTKRHETTSRLRRVLGGLNKVAPIATLTEMIKEVDDELLHCKKQVAEHPATEKHIPAGSRNDAGSEKSLAPSDSTIKNAKKKEKLGSKEEGPQYHLSGSDLDPHPVLIKRSCWIVEEWMRKCNDTVTSRHENDSDGGSVVSVVGGFRDRPQLDVGIWNRQPQGIESHGSSFTLRRKGHSPQSHRQHTNATFTFDLDLDALATDRMPRDASTRRKVKFIERLFSALHPKKTEPEPKKPDKQRRVRFEDVSSPQRHRVRREQSEVEVKDSAVAESVRRLSTISNRDKNIDRSSYSSASSAIPSPKEVRKHVDQNMKGWESDSSTLSSRESDINLGSIIERPATPPSVNLSSMRLRRPGMEPQQFRPSPPKPNSSWQSDSQSQYGSRSHGQSRSSSNALTSPGTATSPSTSRHVRTLPPSFTSIVPPTFAAPEPKSDFAMNRERRRAERIMATPALPSNTVNSDTRKEQDRRVVSPVARELRARRAERASKVPGPEKYHRDDRERLWSSQKA
ncbi:hypothetical protein DL95DRAFT_443609 [Leptodontidium sp. 2 PMI_412]|nr:hypothetical protein DL95DRAFT_443609 [Leptodontidium sp. 2 PMI_412]